MKMRKALQVAKLDLLQRLRSPRLLLLWGAWFLALVLFVLGIRSLSGDDGFKIWSSMSFDVVYLLTLAVCGALAPAMAASAINGDRRNQTLALLQVTPLRGSEIAVGKLISAWVAALSFYGIALIMLIPLSFGMPNLVVGRFISLFVSALLLLCFSALGVFYSAYISRVTVAVAAAFVTIAALLIAPPLIAATIHLNSLSSGETTNLLLDYEKLDSAQVNNAEYKLNGYPVEYCSEFPTPDNSKSEIWQLNFFNPLMIAISPLSTSEDQHLAQFEAGLNPFSAATDSDYAAINTMLSGISTANFATVSSLYRNYDCAGGYKIAVAQQGFWDAHLTLGMRHGEEISAYLLRITWILPLTFYLGISAILTYLTGRKLQVPVRKLGKTERIA